MFDFNIALPIILVIFLTTLFLLNRILFRPLLAVMEQRKTLTSGTKKEAAKSMEHYQAVFEEYQKKIKAAHQEGYRLKDVARAEAAQLRKKRLDSVHTEAQTTIQRMKSDLTVQIDESKQHLRSEVQELADTIASKIMLRN